MFAPCTPPSATTPLPRWPNARAMAGIARAAAAAALASTLWAGNARAAGAEASRPAATATLVFRFSLAADGQWAEVTVPLRASAWHPVDALGAPVSPEHWRALRGAVRGLAIGAHCHGSGGDGPAGSTPAGGVPGGKTHYPCAVELADARWLPAAPTPATASPDAPTPPGDAEPPDWRASTGDTLKRYQPPSVSAFSQPAGAPTLLTLPTAASPPGLDLADFVGLLAPTAFLAGAADLRRDTLRFRLRLSRSQAGGAARSAAPVQGSVLIGSEPLAPPPQRDGSGRAPGTPI